MRDIGPYGRPRRHRFALCLKIILSSSPPARPKSQTVAPERKPVPVNAAAAFARRARSRMQQGSRRVRSSRKARGGPGQGVDASLIGAERGATRTQHMRLERRDARRVNQQPIHHRRSAQCDPAPGEIARINGDRRVGEPAEPFKKIIGMARRAQPDIADETTIFGSARNCASCRSAIPSPQWR